MPTTPSKIGSVGAAPALLRRAPRAAAPAGSCGDGKGRRPRRRRTSLYGCTFEMPRSHLHDAQPEPDVGFQRARLRRSFDAQRRRPSGMRGYALRGDETARHARRGAAAHRRPSRGARSSSCRSTALAPLLASDVSAHRRRTHAGGSSRYRSAAPRTRAQVLSSADALHRFASVFRSAPPRGRATSNDSRSRGPATPARHQESSCSSRRADDAEAVGTGATSDKTPPTKAGSESLGASQSP